MVDTRKLRGILAERGITQTALADSLGISRNTFARKMKRGVFDSDEMCEMITLLEIEDPASVFFANVGT